MSKSLIILIVLSFLIALIIFIGFFYWQSHTKVTLKTTKTVQIKNTFFEVELAQTANKRAIGLMNRATLPLNKGMLFIYPNNINHGPFWMKNTLISLDIIFIDQDYQIVSIVEQALPCPSQTINCPTYPAKESYQYVLEINGGLSKEKSFVIGDLVTIN